MASQNGGTSTKNMNIISGNLENKTWFLKFATFVCLEALRRYSWCLSHNNRQKTSGTEVCNLFVEPKVILKRWKAILFIIVHYLRLYFFLKNKKVGLSQLDFSLDTDSAPANFQS